MALKKQNELNQILKAFDSARDLVIQGPWQNMKNPKTASK